MAAAATCCPAREEKGPHDQGNRPVFAVMSSESDVL